jgi:hypothetical protein
MAATSSCGRQRGLVLNACLKCSAALTEELHANEQRAKQDYRRYGDYAILHPSLRRCAFPIQIVLNLIIETIEHLLYDLLQSKSLS